MQTWTLYLGLLLLTALVKPSLQKTSPCPAVFTYDEKDDTYDSWHGTLKLKTNVPLHGVFIDVIFNYPVYSFGTYFKNVMTDDNVEYRIIDTSHRLRSGEVLVLKFYVKYNPDDRVPLLQQIRFNGQNICVNTPAEVSVRTTPRTTTHRTTTRPTSSQGAIVYPNEVPKRQTRPSLAPATNSYNPEPHVVQPIYPVGGAPPESTNKHGRSHHSVAHDLDPPTVVSRPHYHNASSVTGSPVLGRANGDQFSSRTSSFEVEPSSHSNPARDPSNGRPSGSSGSSYDPTLDETIWVKPASATSPPTRAQHRPTIPSVGLAAGSDYPVHQPTRSRVQIPTTQHYPTTLTSTERDNFFQGDYAFIKSVETSTHYINAYDADICGTVVPKANPLVTHGVTSNRGQFPWHGALYRSTVTELKYLCGATLVGSKLALTAAHCVTLEKTRRPVEASSLLLYFGKTDLSKWNGVEEDAQVDQLHIHPQYNHQRFFSDIAVLLLKNDVKFSNFVRPACLWTFDDDYKGLINKIGLVPGWGYNERGLVSSELSFAQMPVVAHETCIWSNRDFFSKVTSNMSYCAGFKNGTSVCNGDSGGGMVFKQNNRWHVRGIVSVSAALQDRFSCDASHYAVFTDVAKYLRWIKGFM